MRMKSRWALVALTLACAAGMNSCATANNQNLATQSFMWVATTDQMVRSYTLQLSDGVVAQVGAAVATGVQPQAMAITPDGNQLFIANTGDSTIGVYTRNSDGSLASPTSVHSSGQTPVALAIDPTGHFLFVADQGTNDVSSYQISSGSLTPVGATALPTPSPTVPASPSALAVSPIGSFVYVTDSVNNTVIGLSYDGNGALTPVTATGGVCGISGYCVQAGTNPAGVAFSRCAGIVKATVTCANPDGNNLFVSNQGDGTVSVFSACIQTSVTCPGATGSLSPDGAPVAACCGPTTLMVDPASNFVYVLETIGQVGEFQYSPVTGLLTAMSPASASTGASPLSAGITANASNPVNNSNWIFVANTGVSTISGYNVTSTGRLGILGSGPISVPAQPTAILLH